MYKLRQYQQDAVDKLIWSQKLEGADICVVAQGGGKSLIIAELAHRLNQPILILQPSLEILEQNVEKMRTYVDDSEIGIYSASVGRKDFGLYTFATIQSVYKTPENFNHFKQIIIDECDLVPVTNSNSMFMSFLKNIGSPKVIGMTGTPYRMAKMYERLPTGELLTHTTTKLINRQWNPFWKRIIFNITTQDLIKQGYLVPIKYLDRSIIQHNDIPTNISRSDFDLEVYEEKIKSKEDEIIGNIFLGMELGKHILVFCSSIDQAEKLCSIISCGEVITSKTSKKERIRIITDFKKGKIKIVFNVSVLTVGFDFPELDCIIMLRPCRSIRLFGQMCGRGCRPALGKKFCWLIDLVANSKNLGKYETIRIEKIGSKWEILSNKGSFHNKSLFNYKIPKKVREKKRLHSLEQGDTQNR